MKFEFAKYTEITDLYKKYSTDLQEGDGYTRFFICLDVNDFWIVRVLEGFNAEYEKEEGTFLMERNNVQKESKKQDLSLSKVIELVKEDDFSNWDIIEYFDMTDLIDDLDGGFGLN